jgi:hypothetical protein
MNKTWALQFGGSCYLIPQSSFSGHISASTGLHIFGNLLARSSYSFFGKQESWGSGCSGALLAIKGLLICFYWYWRY